MRFHIQPLDPRPLPYESHFMNSEVVYLTRIMWLPEEIPDACMGRFWVDILSQINSEIQKREIKMHCFGVLEAERSMYGFNR